ncbi:MAG TPA: septum formation initiator family protein, partial [Verrucomicrobiae bacterium]|nr:septum formation initiator family protein [Verrucomicrobiae bacterium]
RVVRKRKSHGRAKFLAVSLVVLGFIAGIFVCLQYAKLAVQNHQISQIKRDIAAQKTQNEQLRLQISELGSVSRIKSMAVNQLGMVEPVKYAYLDYQVEQKANVPMVGAGTAAKPAAVPDKPQENTVIRQVAQILSSIFGSEQ